METLPETNIYVLLLEDNKYYIGRTDSPVDRIISHFTNCGSAWTKLHKPKEVIESFVGDMFDEDKWTKKYMHKYGVENVRGASYCQVILLQRQLESIKSELYNVDDKCFKCGEKGHFVMDCKKEEEEEEVDSLVDSLKILTITSKPTTTATTLLLCSRCGRDTHDIHKCYAKWHTNGRALSASCTRCGRDSHTVYNCYAKWYINGDPISTDESDSDSN